MENHPLSDAFRCLREEDKSFVELAIMYKDEGNEWLKKPTQKDRHEAILRYCHALSFIDNAITARESGTEAEVDKSVNLLQLKSQIINNRALVYMNGKNYGLAIKDLNLVYYSVLKLL